ncbi:MAG: ribosome small subunit-dependent GTPase A [Desulfotomaculum sp.]|nr:ribosome small subunit-dependent GTPase A [Desulfotomaculum sp.]
MIEGVVTKAYSGYYYVQSGEIIWTCRLRGKFRLSKQTVLVGDRVRLKAAEKNTGIIYEVLKRRNQLARPLVANIDQAVVVFAASRPDPNLDLLDRFLILAEQATLKPVICLNKVDLLKDVQELSWLAGYRQAGYPVLTVSTKTGRGLEDLRKILSGKISVLAGPSGVGKSSLLNALQPELQLKTKTVSTKTGRGKHTTRHVELIPVAGGGLVADTPGFSNLHLPVIEVRELVYYFPDLAKYYGSCRFNSCTHHQEPQCAVKKALAQGEINPRRYQSYLRFLNELMEQKRRY